MTRPLLLLLIALYGCTHAPVGDPPQDRSGDVTAVQMAPMRVMQMHVGIWNDVARCLGIRPRMPVRWYVAERLVRNDGVLLYGLAHLDPAGPVIVLERAYWLHPGVISHEVVHAITASTKEPTRCTLDVPGRLPMRRISPDSVAYYRSLVTP